MCKEAEHMTLYECIKKLRTAFLDYSTHDFIEANNRLFTEDLIPPRGPRGSPENVLRVKIYVVALLEKLKEIESE